MERWHGESVNHWKTRLKEYQYISCWITKVWHGCSSLHIDFRSQNTLHTSYLIFSPFAHQMEPQQDRGWWETTRVDRPMACGGFAISQHCTHIHNIGVIVRLTSVTATTYCFRHRAWMLASSLAQVSVVQTDGGRTVSFVGTHILSGESCWSVSIVHKYPLWRKLQGSVFGPTANGKNETGVQQHKDIDGHYECQ